MESSSGPEYEHNEYEYEVSEESREVKERQERAMQEFLMKRRDAALAVPTNDMALRVCLRQLGEPITLPGEREMERRERLRRMLMAKNLDAATPTPTVVAMASPEEEDIIQYPFYTEGSKSLLEARIQIAKYSIVSAATRMKRKRDIINDSYDHRQDLDSAAALERVRNLVHDCSEIGDDRPLSGCSFSHAGEMLATCAVSGIAKLWSMPHLNKVSTLKGHTQCATAVAFSPIPIGTTSHSNLLATASADCTARLWKTTDDDDDGSLVIKTLEATLIVFLVLPSTPQGSSWAQLALTVHGDCGT